MDYGTTYAHLKRGCKAAIKGGKFAIDWLRGKKAKPKTKKIKAYALGEKGILGSKGDLFVLPGTKNTIARCIKNEYKLVVVGRGSVDMIAITYDTKGAKGKVIVVNALDDIKVPAKLPPKARFLPIYERLVQWSKKLEIKEEF